MQIEEIGVAIFLQKITAEKALLEIKIKSFESGLNNAKVELKIKEFIIEEMQKRFGKLE
jgi:hypothetical protein